MSSRFKWLVCFFILPLFLYFSIYTWNWKTGHLDNLAAMIGLDVSGWILAPGRWLQDNADEFWSRYVYLVGVRQENEDLAAKVRELEQELVRVSEKARSAERMAFLLRFAPEPGWDSRACRIIGHKLGPNAILETMLVDLGSAHGVRENDPVISPRGIVGRIVKPGLFFSSVLLLSDASSRIPVITSEGRVPAIVQGAGAGAFLEVKFIPRNDPVKPGEVLLSSGLGGVFPKGIPVARVVEVTPSDVSLFQKVYAEPVLALRSYEEVLVLSRKPASDWNATVDRAPRDNSTVRDASNSSAAPVTRPSQPGTPARRQ